MLIRALLIVASVPLVLPAAPLHAQTLLPGAGSAISVTLSPQHPTPGSVVRLEARSPLYDLAQATLTWRVDGKAFLQGEGATVAEIAAGPFGSAIDLSLDVLTAEGGLSYVETTIAPTEIDLLYDADSYTPSFYKGRAWPSEGTRVRLEAIPHFPDPDGGELPIQDLMYTWRRNGDVIARASGRGKFAAVLDAPVLFGTDTIEVEAVSGDGTLTGSASATLSSADPALVLYQNHPLFGIMFNQALAAQSVVPDTEMTFAAVPYFAQMVGPNDPALRWSWRVNDEEVAIDAAQPDELTVNAQNSSGAASIAVTVTHLTNYFLRAHGLWNVTLGSDSGVFGLDMFRDSTEPYAP